MAVYERTYRPYTAGLTAERSRFMVLPRYAYREIFAKRWFVAFFVACFIWPAAIALAIYLPHNSSFLKAIAAQAGGNAELFGFSYDGGFFFYGFMVPQSWMALFLAFIVGPELISTDLRNNGLPLYLARPFSRWEYILGKMSVMVILMSAITWLPGLLLFSLQGYLAKDWLSGHWHLGWAIFAGSWVYIILLCLISLSLSAYVKWKPLARMGLFAVFFIAGGLSVILNVLLETEWASVLNIGEMVRVLWAGLFDVKAFSNIPSWAAWLSLSLFCAFCLGLLARRVRAYEVVR